MSIEFFIPARECANTDDEIQDSKLEPRNCGAFLWREVSFVDIYCTDDANLPIPPVFFETNICFSFYGGVPLIGDWTVLPF